MLGNAKMSKPETPFGKQFRAKYFTNLDKDVYPVNHGSNGLSPAPIHEKYIAAINKIILYIDRFYKVEQKQQYIAALKVIAKVLNCDYHNLAITDNASTGVNTVLRSYPFAKGDSIVIQSTVYVACGNTVKFLKENYGIDYHIVNVNYPTTNKEIVDSFDKKFKEVKPKLCLFDVTTSMPGVIFPYKEMVKLCKDYNVLSLVDGAHGIGSIPQDLGLLEPDFYVSNLHKWFYVPLGCSVLYVDPKHHKNINTFPISHTYLPATAELSAEGEKNRLVDRFFFTGPKNLASIQVIPDAYEFRENVCGGEQAIYDYCHNLALTVGDVVSKKWGGTQVLDQMGGVTQVGTMVTIEIPTKGFPSIVKNWSKLDEVVYKRCIEDYKAYTPCVVHNGKLWARYSCQVYNELEDYEFASDVLLKVLKEVAKEHNLLV